MQLYLLCKEVGNIRFDFKFERFYYGIEVSLQHSEVTVTP